MECYQLWEKISHRDINVFINNAGFGTCGNFQDTDLAKEVSMINVNIRAMHILFKKVLQKMKLQGYGRILNVASSAGLLPARALYGDILCYKGICYKQLPRQVAQELKEEGSKSYVGALCPGPVDTEFNEMADVVFALKGITPKCCVKEALMGMKKRNVIMYHFIKNENMRNGTKTFAKAESA